jgi:SPP1 gp7 family putative phage head morphogenesis protein
VRKVPEPIHPATAEREYHRFLKKYAASYIELMRQGLKEILPDLKEVAATEQPRMDENIESKMKRLMEFVTGRLNTLYPDPLLRSWIRLMIGNVNRNSKSNTQRQVRSGFKKGQTPPDFEPLMRDGHLSPYFQNIIDENVGLIRSIPTLKLPAFKNQLVAMITSDSPSGQIAKAIFANFNITKNRAELIAVDQVGKLNGALEEYRQKELGLKRYRWRTSGDSRVRKDHRKLEGKIFTWKNPPIVDKRSGRRAHPKRDFRCRCWAEPMLDDIIET